MLKSLLSRLGVVDVPSARSSHSVPTIRGAGLAPLCGLIVGYVIVFVVSPVGDIGVLSAVMVASLAAATIGWLEDLIGLPISVRASAQLLVGLGAALAVSAISGGSWWVILLGTFFISGYINVANFMDGINGKGLSI